MIRTTKDKRIASVRAGQPVKGFPADIVGRAQRRLAQLDAATNLADLKAPPSNQLEALRGDRAGQHFGSTSSGVYASYRETATPLKSKSWTTTEVSR